MGNAINNTLSGVTGIVTANGSSPVTGSTVTQHGLLVAGASNAVSSLSVASTGTVLAGNTGADPSFTATPSITSLTLSTPLSIASGGTNASSFSTTDGVVYYDGSKLASTTAGTSTQVLTSNGPGVAPTFQAVPTISTPVSTPNGGTGLSGPDTGSLLVTNGNSAFQMVHLNQYQLLIGTGPSTAPIANTLSAGDNITITASPPASLTISVDGVIPVVHGGTGQSTLTTDAVLTGNGTSGIKQTFLPNGCLLIGQTGGPPQANLPTNGTNISWTAGTGNLTANLTGVVARVNGGTGTNLSPSDGQILIGSGASYFPNTLGTGTGLTSAMGSGTLSLRVIGGGVNTIETTGTTATMVINTRYIANNASPVTFTMPATAELGATIQVRYKGAGGWVIQCNGGQVIQIGTGATSSGGTLTSTTAGDCVTLECTTANTGWIASSFVGTIIPA